MSNKETSEVRNERDHQESHENEIAAIALLALSHEGTAIDVEAASVLLAFSQQAQILTDSIYIHTDVNAEHNQQQQPLSVLRRELEQEEMLHFTQLATTPGQIIGTSLEEPLEAMFNFIGAGTVAVVYAILYLEFTSWDLNAARSQWQQDQDVRADNPAEPKHSGRPLHDLEALFIRNAFCRTGTTTNSRPDYDGIALDHRTFLAGLFLPGDISPCPDRSSSSIASHVSRKILSKADKKLNTQGKWRAARKLAGHDMEKEKANFWDKHGGPSRDGNDGSEGEGAAGGQNPAAVS